MMKIAVDLERSDRLEIMGRNTFSPTWAANLARE